MRTQIEPKEMTAAEQAELWPELTSLVNATVSCSRMTPDDFKQYRGQFVAWSPDGKHIIANSKETNTLDEHLKGLGLDAHLCVIQFVHDIEDRI